MGSDKDRRRKCSVDGCTYRCEPGRRICQTHRKTTAAPIQQVPLSPMEVERKLAEADARAWNFEPEWADRMVGGEGAR